MLGNLSGTHLIVIVFIVLLLFGAPKLPGLARSLGQSLKIFKSEVTTDKKGSEAGDDTAAEASFEEQAASKPAPVPPIAPVAMDVHDASNEKQSGATPSEQKPTSA